VAGVGRVSTSDPYPGQGGGGGSSGGVGSDGFANSGYTVNGTIAVQVSGGGCGGGGGNAYFRGGAGGVRIIYSTSGISRSFPSTNTGNL
jgi:hypothetical protein